MVQALNADWLTAVVYQTVYDEYDLLLNYTVEVGRLHTHRLESLKLVFKPLHKILVNKL